MLVRRELARRKAKNRAEVIGKSLIQDHLAKFEPSRDVKPNAANWQWNGRKDNSIAKKTAKVFA